MDIFEHISLMVISRIKNLLTVRTCPGCIFVVFLFPVKALYCFLVHRMDSGDDCDCPGKRRNPDLCRKKSKIVEYSEFRHTGSEKTAMYRFQKNLPRIPALSVCRSVPDDPACACDIHHDLDISDRKNRRVLDLKNKFFPLASGDCRTFRLRRYAKLSRHIPYTGCHTHCKKKLKNQQKKSKLSPAGCCRPQRSQHQYHIYDLTFHTLSLRPRLSDRFQDLPYDLLLVSLT